MLAGELAKGGEVRAAGLRILRVGRHRHQPRDRDRAARDEVAELGGSDPGLGLLPRDVDLDEHLRLRRAVLPEPAQRRVGGDRVDELHVREDVLDLAALELADEVPAERAGVRLGLGDEVLRAVLAQQRHARLGEHLELLERHVLDRGEQLGVADLRADALGVLAHARGVEAADQLRHTTPAWRPVTPPSARWEKNRSLRHIVHRPTSWTSATPASAELRGGDGLQGEVALPHAGAGHVREVLEHLLADLVAAAARAGADHGGDRALGAELAQREHALLDDPARQRRASRSAPRPRRRRRRAARAGSRRRTRARRRRAARSPGRPRRRPGARALAARRRGARARRGPGGRRGSARAGARPRRPGARGSRRRWRRRRRSAGRG